MRIPKAGPCRAQPGSVDCPVRALQRAGNARRHLEPGSLLGRGEVVDDALVRGDIAAVLEEYLVHRLAGGVVDLEAPHRSVRAGLGDGEAVLPVREEEPQVDVFAERESHFPETSRFA